MKKQGLLIVMICLGVMVFAQTRRAIVPDALKNYACPKKALAEETLNPILQISNDYSPAMTFPEDEIGMTVYDLQSNGASPTGRLVMYDDGSFGAVWTRGMNASAYLDRGTGYNYYNGTNWLPMPTARIESVRTGWPSIAQLGSNGEVVIAHEASGGLVMNKRATQGSGAWTQSTLPLPAGVNTPWWSRVVTSGADHNTIHVMVLTLPTANGGLVYKGQDGALLYYRSTDGGASWVDPGILLPGTDSSFYSNFSGDNYAFVEPQGDNLAFIMCDPWNDMFVLRSNDNGSSWTKTILWEHPYPHWNGEATDTIYCPDGAAHGAFDKNGKLHIAFGVNREISDGTTQSWFPFVDGVAYWNEDMPTWVGGDQLHCLDPDLLYASGNLVGWMQDVDGDGILSLVGNSTASIAAYYLSPTSFPQIAFDDNNNAIMLFSSITETYNTGSQDYRHIWCRASSNNGDSWGQFIDLDDAIDHMFDECVFPSISAKSTAEEWSFIYQIDNEPGMAIRGDEDQPGDNLINFYHLSKIVNSIGDPAASNSFSVSESFPNPVNGIAAIDVTLSRSAPLSIMISNINGQQICNTSQGVQSAGIHKLKIDASKLLSGVYFYTVTDGQQKFTRKLIVY